MQICGLLPVIPAVEYGVVRLDAAVVKLYVKVVCFAGRRSKLDTLSITFEVTWSSDMVPIAVVVRFVIPLLLYWNSISTSAVVMGVPIFTKRC